MIRLIESSGSKFILLIATWIILDKVCGNNFGGFQMRVRKC